MSQYQVLGISLATAIATGRVSIGLCLIEG
jgi:hypothetical protein